MADKIASAMLKETAATCRAVIASGDLRRLLDLAACDLESAATIICHNIEMPKWRPIETAPKDGTRILIWFVHANAAYSKDPVGEGWAAAHEAHWIDHNNGGWTWHGLCGTATAWQPMPAPPVTP